MKKDNGRNQDQEDDNTTGTIMPYEKPTAQHKAEWDKVITAVRAEKKKIKDAAATDPYSFLKPKPANIAKREWGEEVQELFEEFMSDIEWLEEQTKLLGTDQEEIKAKTEFILSATQKALDSLQTLEWNPANIEGTGSDTRQTVTNKHSAEKNHAGKQAKT